MPDVPELTRRALDERAAYPAAVLSKQIADTQTGLSNRIAQLKRELTKAGVAIPDPDPSWNTI